MNSACGFRCAPAHHLRGPAAPAHPARGRDALVNQRINQMRPNKAGPASHQNVHIPWAFFLIELPIALQAASRARAAVARRLQTTTE